jgi:ERF superfamily
MLQQASTSIGAIAAALAKAQTELLNPEKSLSATLSSPGEPERIFRYAPLSSGLDIIRKSLGRHEIATVQTTEIDEAGLIRLRTVLAHASGEWIASDWPVCPVSETAAPHRLGAALTYARRYAVFTLVGIAGEDDLDAPNLPVAGGDQTSHAAGRGNGASVAPAAPAMAKRVSRSPNPVHDAAQSQALRNALEDELGRLTTADELTAWASRALPTKASLTSGDAEAIQAAFAQRIAAVAESKDDAVGDAIPAEVAEPSPKNIRAPTRLRTTPIMKTPRRRDKRHLRSVGTQPCVVCGRTPSDAHHLRFAEPRALGCKVSDEFTVPLCRSHHRALHEAGDERAWWHDTAIDPLPIARALWSERRGSTAT